MSGKEQYVGSAAADDVLRERRRQVEGRGYTAAHDDKHEDGELAQAAMAFLQSSLRGLPGDHEMDRGIPVYGDEEAAFWWPPEWHSMRRRSQREDLVRAAAMCIAEIERVDRASAK